MVLRIEINTLGGKGGGKIDKRIMHDMGKLISLRPQLPSIFHSLDPLGSFVLSYVMVLLYGISINMIQITSI